MAALPLHAMWECSASHGEYVAFLDADDIWMPRKLEKTLAALDSDSGVAMVYTNASMMAGGGELLGTTYTPEDEKRAPAMEDMLSRLWNILPSTAVMKRATFDQIGGFREEFATAHPQWEDGYFMIVAREQGRFVYLDEPTVHYRVAASVHEHLKRRRAWKNDSENPETMRVDRYVRNFELMDLPGARALRRARVAIARLDSPRDGRLAGQRRTYCHARLRSTLCTPLLSARAALRSLQREDLPAYRVDFPAGAGCADDIGGVTTANSAGGLGAGACVRGR